MANVILSFGGAAGGGGQVAWNCPRDLQVGDKFEFDIVPGHVATVLYLFSNGLLEYSFDARPTDIYTRPYEHWESAQLKWRRVEPAKPTTIAKPICYGAKCKRCGDFNEYAEAVEGFTCYGCKR